MVSSKSWEDIPCVVDLNCEIFFKSSGADGLRSSGPEQFRVESREVAEVRIDGRKLSDELAAKIAVELESMIDAENLDDAHESWLKSGARRDSIAKREVAKK